MTMEIKRLVTQEFERGAEEGRKGWASAHAMWGFEKEPLSGKEVLREVFVDREDAIARLSRSLGRLVMGLKGLTVCVGPFGSGVSATLKLLHEALQESGTVRGEFRTGAQLLESREHREQDGTVVDETYFDVFLEETDFAETRYIVVDDADVLAEWLPDYVRRIKEYAASYKGEPGLVVGLHMSGWLEAPAEFRDQVTEQVWLPPLSTPSIVELLRNYILYAKGTQSLEPFDEASLREIATLSGGFPNLAIELARKTLHECASRGMEKAPVPLVRDVAKAFGFACVPRVSLWEMGEDETRALVIEQLVRHPNGVTSSRMSSTLSAGRTTIGYHLTLMVEVGLLLKERKGREVRYAPTLPGRSVLEFLMFKRVEAKS